MAARLTHPIDLRPGPAAYLVAALLVAVCLHVAGGIGPRADAAPAATRVAMTATERGFVQGLNEARREHGLSAFVPDGRLAAAARSHSADMVARDYFAHGRFWVRIQQEGIPAGTFGETLGWTSQASGAVDRIVAAWLASPEHRSVILDAVYRQVGVGVEQGSFKGHPDAVVVTADFHGD